jgi:hypothetical protein
MEWGMQDDMKGHNTDLLTMGNCCQYMYRIFLHTRVPISFLLKSTYRLIRLDRSMLGSDG